MSFKLIIISLLLTSVSISWAQQVGIPNLPSSYLTQSYPLFNSASISPENDGNFLLSYKQGAGMYSVYNQNYLNANYCFGADSIKRHGIGVKVINDQADKYIDVNRFSLLYNYSLILSTHYRLSLGIAPTIINHKKKAQSFGGDAMKGNLDVGLWFQTKKLILGVSINQIVENELVVIEEISVIKPQYVLNTKYNHKIHPLVSLDYQLLYKINTGLSNEEIIGVTVNYQDHYRTSINYEHLGNFYFLLGLKRFSFSKLAGKLSVDFVYGISTLKNNHDTKNIIELMMNYEF